MKKLLIPSLYVVSDVTYMAKYTLEYCLALSASDTNLKILHDKLQLLYDEILNVLENTGKSALTEQLKVKDSTRDQGFVCLRNQLEGAAKSLIDERAALAQPLYAVIEQLGTRMYSLGYKDETAHLESLFKAFDKPQAQDQLTQLGLLPDYQALKDAQAAFAATQDDRYAEQTADENTAGPAGTLATQIIPVIDDIVSYLELFSSLNPATYKSAYDNTVTMINGVNATARARKTKKENSKVDEGSAIS